jgi:hypothetical protein
MKRFVVLSICLLLLCAATASADIMGVTTAGDVGVSATVDTSNAGYNVVDIYVKSIGGAVANTVIDAVEGAWTTTGGQFYVHTGAASTVTFKNYTNSNFMGSGTYSGVNFSSLTAGPSGIGWARQAGTTGTVSNLIIGGWYCTADSPEVLSPANTSDVDGDGYPENLIAEMKVTKGTTKIAFGGGATDKFAYSSGAAQVTAFSVTIPEPSTLALLGCGLFGLLAYAWRKQK